MALLTARFDVESMAERNRREQNQRSQKTCRLEGQYERSTRIKGTYCGAAFGECQRETEAISRNFGREQKKWF